MTPGASLKSGAWYGVCSGLAGCVIVGITGCTSHQPPTPQPSVTPEQVRSHADKAFENLSQEENRPASESGGSMY